MKHLVLLSLFISISTFAKNNPPSEGAKACLSYAQECALAGMHAKLGYDLVIKLDEQFATKVIKEKKDFWGHGAKYLVALKNMQSNETEMWRAELGIIHLKPKNEVDAKFDCVCVTSVREK